MTSLRSQRAGFTMLEVMIVIVIGVLIIGLLLPAVQKIRESTYKNACASNLRQLAIAVHAHRDTFGCMPPFFGTFGHDNPPQLRGSWFAHLMPYTEDKAEYANMQDDIKAANNNWYTWNSTPPSWDLAAMTMKPVLLWTGHGYAGSPNPPPPNMDEPPMGRTGHGVWKQGIRDMHFKILECPSDPGLPKPGRKDGRTSYLANWWVWTEGKDKMDGVSDPWESGAPPRTFESITDGPTNTVLFAEGYGFCDRISRDALVRPEYWGFGIDWNGVKNANLFQVRPRTMDSTGAATPENGPGECNNWQTQTGHALMNVAMADGVVKPISSHIHADVWKSILDPRDGLPTGDEWQNP